MRLRLTVPTVLLLSLSAAAQEWTRFRGPSGAGVSIAQDLPTTFDEDNELWRVPVGGKGHSSPVLWGDLLFLTREGTESGLREVVCFDATSGEEQWAEQCEFEGYKLHSFNSAASSTPAVDEFGVYVLWASGSELLALALDHEGALLWQRSLGSFRAAYGSGSSPILHGDLMILASQNEGDECFLMALDKSSGKTVWKTPRNATGKKGSYASPVMFRPDGSAPCLLFTSQQHGLTAVQPETGVVLWEWNPGLKMRCVASPCLLGNLLFFSTGVSGGGKAGYIVALPDDAGEVEIVPELIHKMRRAIPFVPCALGLDGRYYTFSDGGVATAMEAVTGADVWRERLDGTFFSSPVSNGKTIYIASREGTLFSLAKGGEFEVLGELDLGAAVFATPAIAHGKMYVRTAEDLICLAGQ